MNKQQITFDRFIRNAMIVAGVASAIALTYYLRSVLLPFFAAWLLAYLIYPVVCFFQYTCRLNSRILSILITLALLLAVVVGFFMLSVPPMIEELGQMKEIILKFIERGTSNETIPHGITTFIHENVSHPHIRELLQQPDVIALVKEGLTHIWSVLATTADVLVHLFAWVIALLYLCFILADYENMSEGWMRLIPKRRRPLAQVIINDVQLGMKCYFRGQSLIALLVGILFAAGFSLIDFPVAIGLGIFLGLLNLVPYLQLVGLIPTLLFALLKAADTGDNFWVILLQVAIVFIVVQGIQDLFLTPKIMGKFMRLSPTVILLSLSIWGALLGFVGLIIALPLTSLVTSYYKRYIIKE